MSSAEPYKITPVFDQESLPAALRNEHNTKAGVWGLLRVLEGSVRLVFRDSQKSVNVTPNSPAPIPPEDVHHVEVTGPIKMQVEFYREPPLAS